VTPFQVQRCKTFLLATSAAKRVIRIIALQFAASGFNKKKRKTTKQLNNIITLHALGIQNCFFFYYYFLATLSSGIILLLYLTIFIA